MKIIILCFVIFCTMNLVCFADSVIDTLVSTARGNFTEEQIKEVQDKYRGTYISGSGYVSNVQAEGFTVYIDLVEDKSKISDSVISDIHIEVPQDSNFYDIAKKLNKGQEVSFAGIFRSIDRVAGVVRIHGKVSIIPE